MTGNPVIDRATTDMITALKTALDKAQFLTTIANRTPRRTQVRLILVDDDGTVLDDTEIDAEELKNAQDKPFLAQLILQELRAGK